MSYILEALRKSDEERQKNGGQPARPALSFAGRTSVPRRRKFAFSLILMSFILVVAVILGGGWWWSRQDPVQTSQTTRSGEAGETVPGTAASEKPEKTPAPPRPAVLQTMDSPAPSRPAEQPAMVSSPSELLTDLQEELPELRFSGHVYSPTPHLRMIMINDSVYREGDPVSDSLSLAEITERGVIMRAGNKLFSIDLL